jgi:hypothetical protein
MWVVLLDGIEKRLSEFERLNSRAREIHGEA